jgi:hypothetical protein
VFGNSVSNTQVFTGSLQVSGSTHYLLGSVGIGTTSPDTQLHVGAAVNVAPKIRLELIDSGNSINATQEYGTIQWKGNDGQGDGVRADIRVFGEGTSGETYMTFATMPAGFSANQNALERVRIDSVGNVGIGTSSPVSVSNYTFVTTNNTSGSGYITQVGGSTSMYLYSTAAQSTISEQRALPLVFETSGTERMRIGSNGNTSITSTDENALRLINSGGQPSLIRFNDTSTTNDPYIGSYGNALAFGIYGVGESMRIDSSRNVGIGVTSPSTRLHVRSSGNPTITLDGSDGAYTSILQLTGAGGGGGKIVQTGGSNILIFEVNSGDRMSIDSSGNVGIGTNSPATLVQAVNDTNDSATFSSRWNAGGYWSQLEIKNYSSNLNDQNSPQFKIMHNFNDGLNNGYIGFHRGSGLDGGFLSFGSNGTERMRINSSGDVGIGTTSPSYKLDVLASSGENYIRVSSAANQDGGFRIAENGTNKWLLYNVAASDAFAIYDNTAVAERLRIDSSGNVGIGTASPSTYAGIAGTKVLAVGTTTGNNGVNVVSGTTSTGNYTFSDSGGNDRGGLVYYHTADLMTILTAGTEKIRILSDGNVGIGTTSPLDKLDIRGDVKIIKTTTAQDSFGGPVLSLGDTTSEVGVCGGIVFAELLSASPNNVTMGMYYDGKLNRLHFTGPSDSQSSPGQNLANATKHLTILRDTGLVGIGDTTPAVALDVAGQVRASTGILFGTDTAAANALDDYEEGTWTPVLATGGVVNSTLSVSGVYCKVGQIVTLRFYLRGNITTDGTEVTISGIPFDYPSGGFGISWAVSGTLGGNIFANNDLDHAVINASTDRIYRQNGNSVATSTDTYTFEGFVVYMTNV